MHACAFYRSIAILHAYAEETHNSKKKRQTSLLVRAYSLTGLLNEVAIVKMASKTRIHNFSTSVRSHKGENKLDILNLSGTNKGYYWSYSFKFLQSGEQAPVGLVRRQTFRNQNPNIS